jgi:hypothetical protein
MCLLGPSRIDRTLSANLKKHKDTLHTALAAEEAFDQPIIDELCYITAWCRTVLNDAVNELEAEEKRLAKDVFADRVIADVFHDVCGDETPFPQRVYDNIAAVGDAYRAGQQGLDAFEQDLRREWEEVSKMSKFKRKDFVLLARRKMVSIIGEVDKAREGCVEESKRLEKEIKMLQSTLKMKEELKDATEEWHEAQENM